jgi:hypothetical protein
VPTPSRAPVEPAVRAIVGAVTRLGFLNTVDTSLRDHRVIIATGVVARERLGNARSAAQRVCLAGWTCEIRIFEEVAR